MPDVKAKVDLDLGDLKDRLDEFTSSLEDAVDLMDQWHDTTIEKSDYMKQAYAGMVEGIKDINKEQATASEETAKKVKSIGQAYEEAVAKMRRERGVKGIIGEMLPQQAQFMGIQNSMAKLKGSILSELPFGGLIGLMVLGGKREEEVRAMGTTVGRVFQQAGQAGRAEMSLISRDVRRLGVMLGKGPTGLAGEAASAAAAFAQAGIDIESVVKGKFSEPIKGSRGSILEASMAIDSLFKQASGTAARQMGELVKDFNQNAQESTRIIASIGLAARDSGTSVAAFTGSIMRSAQALRTQRVDIEEVAEAQLRFQKLLERNMPGVTQQFAAGYAERAIGQVTQGLAGMSVGLSAVLGERMTARGVGGGGPKTGLEAYYALREGFGGRGQTTEEGGMFVESVRELLKLAQENGRTVEEQRFFLEKMGFGFEGSKAIVEVGKEAAKTNDIQGAIKNHQKEFNRAFVDRAAETSSFQRSLLKIQNGLAKIGAGLLGATIAGLQSIVYGIKYLSMGLFGDEAAKKASGEMIAQSAEMSTRAIKMMMGGAKEVMGGARMGILSTLMTGAGGKYESYDEKLKRIKQREDQIKRGEAYEFSSGEDTGVFGSDITETVTRSELEDIGRRGKARIGERKTSAIGVLLRNYNDSMILRQEGLYTELMQLYKKEEGKTGRGEEAVYQRLQQDKVIGGMVGDKLRSQMLNVEQREEQMTEVNVPGKGKIKAKVVFQILGWEGQKGLPEAP